MDDADYIETLERFLFLYRRQRAHPGFDLHSLLMKVVEGMGEDHFDPAIVKDQAAALRAMDWLSGRLAQRGPGGRHEDDARHRERFLARLDALSHIHRYFNRAVSLSRSAMQAPFAAVLDAWCARAKPGAVIYVVTSGYSKTVRELIREGLGPRWERQRGVSELRPHLFQLLAGDEDELDSRLMTWELRDARGRETRRLAAGSGEMLVTLTRRGDRVLVLLGAEAVDVDRRVVHPRSVLERLRPVVERLASRRIPVLVVVAAEAYKRHEAPFASGPLYRGYFERLGIYEAELVNLVISESATDPADWKRVIRRQLRLPRLRSI